MKESVSAPWRVDPASVAIFRDHLRTEALAEIILTTRADGEPLREPLALLLAGLSDVGPIGSRQATARVRRDEPPAVWEDSHVATTATPADVLAFGAHLDRAGTHYLFAGLSNGRCYRGGYEPGISGQIHWFSHQPERTDPGPVVGFAEANGLLYAATGLHQATPGGPVTGGLYVRADAGPGWTLVHQWPLPTDLAVVPEERWFLRGLTAVPEPHGDARDVLLAARAWPGVIERIDPHPDLRRGHVVTVELDVRSLARPRVAGRRRLRLSTVTVGCRDSLPFTIRRPGRTCCWWGFGSTPQGLGLQRTDRPISSAIGTRPTKRSIPRPSPPSEPRPRAAAECGRSARTSPSTEEGAAQPYSAGTTPPGARPASTASIVRGSWSAWPRLAISGSRAGEWRLDWQAAGADSVLEQADDPAASGRWRRVPGRPTLQPWAKPSSFPHPTRAPSSASAGPERRPGSRPGSSARGRNRASSAGFGTARLRGPEERGLPGLAGSRDRRAWMRSEHLRHEAIRY